MRKESRRAGSWIGAMGERKGRGDGISLKEDCIECYHFLTSGII